MQASQPATLRAETGTEEKAKKVLSMILADAGSLFDVLACLTVSIG